MKLYPETKQSLIKIFSTIILPVMILAVLGVGFILAYNILKQGEASNAAVPEYDMDLQIPIEGIELYRNIDKNEIKWVEAARGELLVRLNDDQPLYEIAMIANKYNMNILRRYLEDSPSFRLQLSEVTQTTPSEQIQPNTNINQTQSTTTLQATPDTSDLPKSDGKIEDIWLELKTDPRVYYAGLNSIEYPAYVPNDPDLDRDPETGYFGPDNKKPELEWIDADRAWQKLADSGLDKGGSEDVWIAIIDTGVDLDHPDLAENIAPGGKDFAPGGDGQGGEVHGGSEYMYLRGHGTKVAGVAAEVGDNNVAAAGVAFNVKILSIRACYVIGGDPNDMCPKSNTAEAIKYATSKEKVRIINLSMGDNFFDINENDAIQEAWAAGKVVVAGAGNDKSDEEFYPAAYDNVIAVAALNHDGSKRELSNYGEWVDISAYGTDTYTTDYDNEYTKWFNGTSAAGAQVSGAVALLLSLYPDLSNEEARDITIQRAHTIFAERGLPQLGCGVLNVGDMLNSKAPIIESPKCITRFWLGEKIELQWKPHPDTSPDSYRIHYYKVEGSFPPPKPDDGTAITDTSWTVESKDAEMLGDGTWAWRVAAWFPNDSDNGMMYWTSPQTVFKHTGAQISNPKDYKIISAGEVFDWEDIANATNYVAHIDCDFFPPNPDPNPVKFGLLGYLISNNSSQSQHTLTTAEWNLLQFFAEQDPYGQPIECSWSVVGTRITDKYLWHYLELEKDQKFLVP